MSLESNRSARAEKSSIEQDSSIRVHAAGKSASPESNLAKSVLPASPFHPQVYDPNPIWNAHRNYRNGLERAHQDSSLLQEASNADFVRQLNNDMHIGPHLEWMAFSAALLTKGASKAFVVGQIGKDTGVMGRLAVPGGIALGAGGAAFLTYELAEYLENSGKANAFEKRLLEQGANSFDASMADESSGKLPQLDLVPEYITQEIPSVRNLVDATVIPLKLSIYKNLLGSEPVNHKQEMRVLAQKHDYMTNDQFVAWAQQQTSHSLKHQLIQDGIFSGFASVGGLYTGSKLGFGKIGAVSVALLAAASGVALSRLKSAAEENTDRASLYEARLLQHKH